jgi:hypothetical protein
MNFQKFNRYTCTGDTRTIEAGGLRIVATVHHDCDSTPRDFDCYTEEDIAAFERGEWCYVGLVLSVYAEDVLLLDHAASLWGIDCNWDSGDYITECADDLLPEAFAAGKAKASKLSAALATVAA